jgi:putative ABC transport system ATP-binding protein
VDTVDQPFVARLCSNGHTKVVAAQDISLAVQPGKVAMIMGSGKTTPLPMLGCLLKPTSGRSLISGEDVTALPERKRPGVRRRNFGLVYLKIILTNHTIG